MRKDVPFFLLLILTILPLQAQIENDKIAHFGVGALSGAAGAFVASEITEGNRFWTVTGSIATSLLAGLAKEAIDQQSSNSWDNADLGATVLGGVTVGVTIELLSKKDGKKYRRRIKKTSTYQNNVAVAEFLSIDAQYNRIQVLNDDVDE